MFGSMGKSLRLDDMFIYGWMGCTQCVCKSNIA